MKAIQVEGGEWLYKGCYIQKSEHPKLVGKYEVFKNDENQTHIGRCNTFAEAEKLCEENECDIPYDIENCKHFSKNWDSERGTYLCSLCGKDFTDTISKTNENTASIDRDGNLSINGTFNFEGSLVKLRKLIDNTIVEYGEDTECRLNLFGSFPHRWSSHLIITNKQIK